MQYEGLQQDKFQNTFRGFDKRWLAGDGAICEMMNVTGHAWPHLCSRPWRAKYGELTAPQGMIVHDGTPIWVDGGKLYWNGVEVEGLTLDPDTDKELVVMGRRLLIWPDKMYYNFDPDRTEPEYGSLEAESPALARLCFCNDSYAGETAECNGVRVYDSNIDFHDYFKVGDAVHFNGCRVHQDNGALDGADRYVIIREISDDGKTLRFYPYSLTLDVGTTVDEDGKIYIGGKKGTPSVGTVYWFIDPETSKYWKFTWPTSGGEKPDPGDTIRWEGGDRLQLMWTDISDTAAPHTTGHKYFVPVTQMDEPGRKEREISLTEYINYYEYPRIYGRLATGTYYFRWPHKAGSPAVQYAGYSFTLTSALAEGDWLAWDGSQLMNSAYTGTVAVTNSDGGGTEVELGTLQIERRVPEIEHPFVHNNRLWGTSGNYIRSSALGDPKNWYKFDANISTGSWELEYLSEGGFTGGISYLGYPIFFKHREIIKIMGYKPSNFETSVTMHCIGTNEGRSLAVAGGILIYYGINGFQAYQGSFPASLHGAFAGRQYSGVIAGSDGDRYYAACSDEAGGRHLFVYDTLARGWYEEDPVEALAVCRGTGLWLLDEEGGIWNEDGQGEAEDDFDWLIEWGEMDGSTLDKKLLNEVSIRLRLAAGARAKLWTAYNDGTEWMEVQQLTGDGVRTQAALFSPRRCDRFRLKLTGSGQMELAGVTLRYSDSSWGRLERKRYGQL